MSRALVIRGADFAANAVAQVNVNLPYDAEVEYLQGDGTAFIDTGITPTNNTRFNLSINITTPSGNVPILGSRTSAYVGNMVLYFGWGGSDADKKWNYRYGTQLKGASNSNTVGDYNVSNIATASTCLVTGAASATIAADPETFTTLNPIYLFEWNRGDGTRTDQIANNTALKIKSCKLYQGTTLVRDFIPVRVGSVGYLYDKVSKELFGNEAGSGAFVIGADK